MGLAVAETAGLLRPIDAATAELAPGVSAHHGPGHTPGHYVVCVSSNGEAAYLLGDVVHHPLQLNDQGISFLSEAEPEPERALRAREELLTALQGRSVPIGMTHFPGLDSQKITTASRRAWSTTGWRLTQTCPIRIRRIRFVNWRARPAQNVTWGLTTPDVPSAPCRIFA
jgi:glyoxylase-like metal-dependent hydrolase (beta-lactamase superfamily II)